jgi:hypothetical protein
VTYSFGGGTDDALFTIDADDGEVRLIANPDYETKSSYSFAVTATDAAGNSVTQTVGLEINNLDEVAPVFDSGTTATAIAENSGANQMIYDANANDPASDDGPSDPVTYSFGGGTDDALFTIDADNGEVRLIANPDYETKSSYSFAVTATDAVGNAATQTVTLAINNRDEVAPVFDDSAISGLIDENSGAGLVVYTASATDPTDDGGSSDPVTYSFGGGTDDALFTIDADDGEVRLIANPDYETKSSYSFAVTATDAAGNSVTQTVGLEINNLDEVAPVFDSGTTATAIAENSGANQMIYDANANDPASDDGPSDPVTYSFGGGTDDALFTIDADNGEVRLIANPDYETKSSYSFAVTATDAVGNAATQTVTLAINNRDEVAPVFDDSAISGLIDENSGAGLVVYTASATDPTDDGGSSDPVTYSFGGGTDDALFTIDADDGEVRLIANPDYETKSSYSFAVTATDAAGNSVTQTVGLEINNLDEVAPVFDSGTTATAIAENSGANQMIYDANANDPASDDGPSDPVTYSFGGGTDDALFTIDADNGEVRLIANPDYETKSSYSFAVTATDAVGNAATQTVTLAINDLLEFDDTYIRGLGNTPNIDDTDGGTDLLQFNQGSSALTQINFYRHAGPGSSTDNFHFEVNGDDLEIIDHFAGKPIEYLEFTGTGTFYGYNFGAGYYAISTDYSTPVDGTSGNDVLVGDDNDTLETFNGLGGNDIIFGQKGNDSLNGGNGNDLLVGGADDDTINGDADNDVLLGGQGDDTMAGGTGADIFAYADQDDGEDQISDFSSTDDSLYFQNSDFELFSGGNSWTSISSGEALSVTTGGGAGTSIAGAKLVIWNTGASKDNIDTIVEVDNFLDTQNGTFNGGVFVLAYTDVGGSNRVGLYYDPDADSTNGADAPEFIASFTSYTDVTTIGVPTFADFIGV